MNPVEVPFYRRVEDALTKTRMRYAVRHTSGRVMESRRAAIADLESSDAIRDEARTLARYTVDLLSASDDPVVVPSGSCGDMVIHQYAALLAGDPEYGPRARAVADRTYELTTFLTRVLGVTDLGATAQGTIAYHACCHGLRGLGVDAEPKALLAHVKGATVCPLAEAEICCGFGGLFSVKMADISGEMLKRKLDAIEASGADTIAVTDVSCGMHMNGGLRRRRSAVRVVHVADILAGPSSGDAS